MGRLHPIAECWEYPLAPFQLVKCSSKMRWLHFERSQPWHLHGNFWHIFGDILLDILCWHSMNFHVLHSRASAGPTSGSCRWGPRTSTELRSGWGRWRHHLWSNPESRDLHLACMAMLAMLQKKFNEPNRGWYCTLLLTYILCGCLKWYTKYQIIKN